MNKGKVYYKFKNFAEGSILDNFFVIGVLSASFGVVLPINFLCLVEEGFDTFRLWYFWTFYIVFFTVCFINPICRLILKVIDRGFDKQLEAANEKKYYAMKSKINNELMIRNYRDGIKRNAMNMYLEIENSSSPYHSKISKLENLSNYLTNNRRS